MNYERRKLLFGQSYYSDRTLKYYLRIKNIYEKNKEKIDKSKCNKKTKSQMKFRELILFKKNELNLFRLLREDAKRVFETNDYKLNLVLYNLKYREDKLKLKIKYLTKLYKTRYGVSYEKNINCR